MTGLSDMIASLSRNVADFPEPGVQFKDLTPVFADRDAMAAITDALADFAAGADLVAGIDSRGFLLGCGRRHPAAHRRPGHSQGRQAAAAGAQRGLRTRVRRGHYRDSRRWDRLGAACAW